MSEIPPEQQTFAADWTAAEDFPARLANQALIQVGVSAQDGTADGIYITFGHSQPPIVYGSPEQMKEQLSRYQGRLRIEPVARVFLPRGRVEELVGALSDSLRKLDAQERASRPAESPRG